MRDTITVVTDKTRIMQCADHGAAPDPGLYGASFAEVYDEWYPGGDESDVVHHIEALVGRGARILELGVGTGRLALPLVDAGFEVWGIDSSPQMLDALAAKDPAGSVTAVLADAGDPSSWPTQVTGTGFDCVLGACNLLLNLDSTMRQRACVQASAGLLRPGGALVVELQHLAVPDRADGNYTMARVTGDMPVVVATEVDPLSGSIEGQHIELRSDGTETVRPWRVHPLALGDLHQWCEDAGLVHEATWADFAARPHTPESANSVVVHRRPPPPR